MGQSTQELRREIEDARSSMSRDLDAIGDRVSPRRMAERRVQRTRRWFSSAREHVFGMADHARARGGDGMHDVADSLSERAHAVAGTVGEAPQTASRRTQGNPMAAGAVAFGVGFLASLVTGPTEVERDAVARVADAAQPIVEPLKEQLGDAAHQVADTVKEQGALLVEDVRADAGDRAASLRETAHDVAQDSRQQRPR